MWKRSADFRALFRTDKVLDMGGGVFCCRAREGPLTHDEGARDAVRKVDADKAYKIHKMMQAGQKVTYQQVQDTLKFHFFSKSIGASSCTCYAFLPKKQCKHVLAIGLRSGADAIPVHMDSTPLVRAGAGRRRKAGDCYAKEAAVAPPAKKPASNTRA